MRSHSRSLLLARRGVPTLAAALLSIFLAGCGGGVEGTYTMSDEAAGVQMSLTLGGGDEATMTLKGGPSSMSSTGTYRADGDQVTVTFDGDSQVFELADGKLTGHAFGDSIVLVKD